MATLRQTSFAAGELSPLLWGRTDLEMFGHGARKLLNFFVNKQGSAVSRPGMKQIGQLSIGTKLIPFVYSDSTSYVLELGGGNLRVHHPTTGYTGIQLATGLSTNEVQWAQVGGSLYLAHPDHAPLEVMSPSAFTGGVWLVRSVRFGPPGNTASDVTPIAACFKSVGGSPLQQPLLVSATPTALFVADASHPAREWKYKVASLMRHNTTGQTVETLPVDITQWYDGASGFATALPTNNLIVLYPDKAVTLRHMSTVGASAPSNWEPVGQVYYRGRGDVFGLIGTTRYAQDFVDDGTEPNYQVQPRRGVSPFPTGEYPSAVAFYQQRLCFGGTTSKPSALWASATDDWTNFDELKGPFVRDDMPIEVTLASRKRERIRSMVASQRLVALTDSSAWTTGGATGSGFGVSVENHVEDEVGAQAISPIVVDGAILYVRAKGRGVRALQVADGGQMQAMDVSWHAEHFFRERLSTVTSWCFARDPWDVAWVVRADGVLLSCTRTGRNDWAWAQHRTGVRTSTTAGAPDDFDRVLDVVCVPAGDIDIVLLAVERVGGVYLEQLTQRIRPTQTDTSGRTRSADVDDGSYLLDGHIIFDNDSSSIGITFSVPGLSHLEGRDVWCVAPGNAPQGPFRVSGGSVVVGPFEHANLDMGGIRICIGLPYTDDLELLDAAPGRLNQKTTVRVGLEVDSAVGLEAGEDFDHLVPWRQRSVADSYEYPSAASALVVIDVKGSWRKTGRAVLRQAKPLPVIVLGVTREVDGGS